MKTSEVRAGAKVRLKDGRMVWPCGYTKNGNPCNTPVATIDEQEQGLQLPATWVLRNDGVYGPDPARLKYGDTPAARYKRQYLQSSLSQSDEFAGGIRSQFEMARKYNEIDAEQHAKEVTVKAGFIAADDEYPVRVKCPSCFTTNRIPTFGGKVEEPTGGIFEIVVLPCSPRKSV